MIPIACLRAVKRIIVHMQTTTTPCADGRASALLARAALPDVPIIEMAYGSPEHEALVVEPGLLFLDFSPPKKRLLEFVCAGGAGGYATGKPGAIVLDHHKPELVTPFGECGVWGDNTKAESGAALALREVLAPLRGPEPGFGPDGRWKVAENLARLAAIRDTWQRSDPRWDDAGAMSAALVFPPLDDLLAMGTMRFAEMARDLGPMLLKKRRLEAADAAATAWRCSIRPGLRVAVVPSLSLTSDVCDLLADEIDVVAGFGYVHESGGGLVKLQWSLRSRGAVNITRIAEQFGGGGHPNGQAAGFSMGVTTDPFAHPAESRSPYATIHGILRDPAVVAST